MLHDNPAIQDIIDIAFDTPLTIDEDILNEIVVNLHSRDEVLALACGDTDEAFHFMRYFENLVIDFGDNLKDLLPAAATIAAIANYVNGDEGRAQMFSYVATNADQYYRLNNLFVRLADIGTPSEMLRTLVLSA